MKKTIYVTLMALAIILTLSVTADRVYANAAEQVARDPLTGPDGENLYPGGVPPLGPQYQIILHDSFSSWNSSIFSIRWGNPTMANGVLNLPHYSRVTSSDIPLAANETYRITLGGLDGTIDTGISSSWNGLQLMETNLTGTGGDVSFYYTHRHNPFTLPGQPVFIDMIGVGNSTINSITIERQLYFQ